MQFCATEEKQIHRKKENKFSFGICVLVIFIFYNFSWWKISITIVFVFLFLHSRSPKFSSLPGLAKEEKLTVVAGSSTRPDCMKLNLVWISNVSQHSARTHFYDNFQVMSIARVLIHFNRARVKNGMRSSTGKIITSLIMVSWESVTTINFCAVHSRVYKAHLFPLFYGLSTTCAFMASSLQKCN